MCIFVHYPSETRKKGVSTKPPSWVGKTPAVAPSPLGWSSHPLIFGPDLRCLESRFADSNCHRFVTISNRTIRNTRPKTVRIAVKTLLFSFLR